MKNKIICLVLPIIILTGCNNKQSFKVSGVIQNNKNKYVYLKRVDISILNTVDSSEISKKGNFSFKVRAHEPNFYQVSFSDNNFITILAGPGESIRLDFKDDNLYSDYQVSGSKGSEQVRMLDLRLAEAKRKLDSIRAVYNTESGKPGFSERGPALEADFSNVLKDLRKKNIEFIITNTTSMASIKALYQRIDNETYVLYDPRDLQYMKIVTDSLMRYYPNSKQVQALAADTKKELDKMYTRQLQNLAITKPSKRLDPNLKDISGKRIALSSLRGKYVLLTFWSIESKECIAENLRLKELYRKYNKSGFEIYQINLDANEDNWRNEVKFDELPWISTREDDVNQPENAILFNVKSLPANFLFDRDGEIVATNLHGNSLQIKLNQLFSK